MAANLMAKLRETLVGGPQTEGENQSPNQQETANLQNQPRESVPQRQQESNSFLSNTQPQQASSQLPRDTQSTSQGGQQNVYSVDSLVNEALEGDTQSHGAPTRDNAARQDPRDASNVPPSVLSQHVGGPTVEHDYPEDSSTQRHSSASHQEAHILGK